MSLRRKLVAFIEVVAAEADRNEAFRSQLQTALGLVPAEKIGSAESPATHRKGGRRAPAVLDPVEIARQGENVLREQLSKLDLEQLRNIVAQYGMDSGKLVMKWKDVDRVVNRIIELAVARAKKGEAFRA